MLRLTGVAGVLGVLGLPGVLRTNTSSRGKLAVNSTIRGITKGSAEGSNILATTTTTTFP